MVQRGYVRDRGGKGAAATGAGVKSEVFETSRCFAPDSSAWRAHPRQIRGEDKNSEKKQMRPSYPVPACFCREALPLSRGDCEREQPMASSETPWSLSAISKLLPCVSNEHSPCAVPCCTNNT